MRRLGSVLLAAVALVAATAPAADAQRPRGDARLLANVPSPGFPASAYPHPNGNVYVGTYINPNGTTQKSRVLEYTGDGQLSRSWTVEGQDLSGDHGIQAATSDAQGRLVLLDRKPARALKLDTDTGEFTEFATFRDLQPCSAIAPTDPCSPAAQDLEPMANYAAWGPDGSLYVTDYLQAVVWRVPPTGGEAQVWLADRRLDGNEFGTTGIALAPDQKRLLVAQGSSATGLGAVNPATGKLYSVPIGADGKPGEITQLWESGPAELPDGFGIGRSGRIYITLANGNAIAVLEPDGREVERFSSPLFDTPSSAKFLGTRLMVPNQAFLTGDPARQTLVDVEAGEPGSPELIPGRDGAAPRISAIGTRKRSRRRVTVTFRSSEPARATLVLERLTPGKRWIRSHSATIQARAGANRGLVSLNGVRGRVVRVVVTATDPAGNARKRVSRRFRVR